MPYRGITVKSIIQTDIGAGPFRVEPAKQEDVNLTGPDVMLKRMDRVYDFNDGKISTMLALGSMYQIPTANQTCLSTINDSAP